MAVPSAIVSTISYALVAEPVVWDEVVEMVDGIPVKHKLVSVLFTVFTQNHEEVIESADQKRQEEIDLLKSRLLELERRLQELEK